MITTVIMFILIGLSFEAAKDTMNTLGMARITLGSVVNSIKGSIGEMVYSTWKGISYIRAKAVTISNPQSADQMDVRSRVAEVAKYWNDSLSANERAAWEAYALTIVTPTSGPGDIIKPATGPFSGYTAFLRNNILMFTTGQQALGTFQPLAPIGVTPPDAPTDCASAWAANTLQVSWTPGTIPGVKVATWARGVDIKVHAQIIAATATAAGISLTPNVNVAGGKSLPLTQVRGIFDVQVMAVDNLGQPSPASNLVRGIKVTGI
jgi:hypothetical protein